MKRLIAGLMVLAMVLCLASCGSKEADLKDMAKDLLDSGAFTDQLNEPAEGVAQQIYGFDAADVQEYVTEVPKLQNAVVGTAGQYAVLVVSNDSYTCQGIVEKYLNK